MTTREFERALHDLARDGDATFARHTPEVWTEAVLHHQPARDRRGGWIAWTGIWLWIASVVLGIVGTFLWDGPLGGLLLKCGPIALLTLLQGVAGPSLIPLLVRLDDVRLVPLWLGVLPSDASVARNTLLERLAQRLPEWRDAHGALPATAASRLRYAVERLCKQAQLSPTEVAFLVAVLPSLEGGKETGKALDRLRTTTTDDAVRDAADTAIQRLGR